MPCSASRESKRRMTVRFTCGWTMRREWKNNRDGRWILRSRHGRRIDKDYSCQDMIKRHPECQHAVSGSGPLVKLGDVLDGRI